MTRNLSPDAVCFTKPCFQFAVKSIGSLIHHNLPVYSGAHKEERFMKHSAVEQLRDAFVESQSRQRTSVSLRFTIPLAALLILITATETVLSQSATTARISGVVSDPNKAVLPGVEV